MIALLVGRIIERSHTWAVIDVGGVGYLLTMSTRSLSALPGEGETTRVYTHLQVRDDEMSLFGFIDSSERELFKKLITVSGVGPKVAMSALSAFPPDVLITAIHSDDVALVCEIPGIGKKTAQRLIMELKDGLDLAVTSQLTSGATQGASSVAAEVREALLAMGFSPLEASSVMTRYQGDPSDAGIWLTDALKRLGGGI